MTGKSGSESGLQLLERRNEELRALVEIGKALTSTLDIQEILNVIMDKVSLLLRPQSWSLFMVDEKSGELRCEIVVSPRSERFKGVHLRMGEEVACWVALHGEPLLVADVKNDVRFAAKYVGPAAADIRSVICVPIRSKSKVLGVVELVNNLESAEFDDADLKILATIADYAAIAIENARYLEKMNELATLDDLTGLFNSRHLHNLLEYEVERASRYETDLSVVFIDLDYFKNVNDTYGHLVGSRLLTEMGHLILANIRKVDIAARYGGDEFVITLPNTSKEDAYRMSEKLRKVINSQVFLAKEGYRIKITASFGIASFPADARSKADLIGFADRAMYEVKATTRDGIRLYSTIGGSPAQER